MATLSQSPELASMDSFRAAVPFGNGPQDTADRLCAVGRYRALERSKALHANPNEDRLVFVASGCAKLVAQSTVSSCEAAINNHVLAFHFAGDIVSVLRQSDADFRLIALSDLELVVFPSNQFLDVAQDDPVVLRSVLTLSLQALHRSRTRMMQLGHKSAHQRIADFLISMAERLCGCASGACEFSLPMSRRDIGDSLGLKIETVSRQFTELRESGLIETEGRSIVRLTDINRLAEEAGTTLSPGKPPQT